MYTCMCVYVYACPVPHCIITFVRNNVQKSTLYVCLPLSFINFWQPLSNYLPFIWSSMNKHTAGIWPNDFLHSINPYSFLAVFFFIVDWLACPVYPTIFPGSLTTKKDEKRHF